MNPKPLDQAKDEELRHVAEALRRARVRACELAMRTGTDIVFMRDGRIVKERPTRTDVPEQLGDRPPTCDT